MARNLFLYLTDYVMHRHDENAIGLNLKPQMHGHQNAPNSYTNRQPRPRFTSLCV